MPSAVKSLALEHGLPVMQPQSRAMPTGGAGGAARGPDGGGRLWPDPAPGGTRYPAPGLHQQPRLAAAPRGAAPIQRAVEAGDAESGVTVMQMEAGLDTGPMLLKVSTPISAADTGGSLHDRLAALGPKAVVEAIAGLVAGTSWRGPGRRPGHLRAQAEQGRGTPRLEPSGRRTGAPGPCLHPWPVCHTSLADAPLKVLGASLGQAAGARNHP